MCFHKKFKEHSKHAATRWSLKEAAFSRSTVCLQKKFKGHTAQKVHCWHTASYGEEHTYLSGVLQSSSLLRAGDHSCSFERRLLAGIRLVDDDCDDAL